MNYNTDANQSNTPYMIQRMTQGQQRGIVFLFNFFL